MAGTGSHRVGYLTLTPIVITKSRRKVYTKLQTTKEEHHVVTLPIVKAQQQLARWASEDTMGGQPGPSGGSVNVGSAVPREYYPSPSSSTSEEPPSIARAPAPTPGSHVPHPDHATIHRPKRYPEYKH
ncbi:uncharacterized protein [Diabrotica undecimpunctata]|uniref:uncharacterized protein n=1 Tax=Diabrotica undecimpunctata TaxID=50387 RepID=UPI003B63F256